MLTCFRSRHQRERRTHLKQRHHNQNTTNRMPKGPFLSQTSGQTVIKNDNNKKISKTYMQRHTMTEIVNQSRSTALERSVETLLGGFNRFYVATILALSSTVVYTRHLFSPREGFLTHQCYISENTKIKRIQK